METATETLAYPFSLSFLGSKSLHLCAEGHQSWNLSAEVETYCIWEKGRLGVGVGSEE